MEIAAAQQSLQRMLVNATHRRYLAVFVVWNAAPGAHPVVDQRISRTAVACMQVFPVDESHVGDAADVETAGP